MKDGVLCREYVLFVIDCSELTNATRGDRPATRESGNDQQQERLRGRDVYPLTPSPGSGSGAGMGQARDMNIATIVEAGTLGHGRRHAAGDDGSGGSSASGTGSRDERSDHVPRHEGDGRDGQLGRLDPSLRFGLKDVVPYYAGRSDSPGRTVRVVSTGKHELTAFFLVLF